MAKLAIIEQTVQFCCVFMKTIAVTFPIFANVCNMCCGGGGGYPIVLWELSLIAVQSYYFLLKYLLRHSHSPQFNVLCQEKQQGICKHSS